MRSLLIHSILLTLCVLSVSAQDAAKPDSVKRIDYSPTGVRIGTDALMLARNFYDKTFTGWEINSDVDFFKYHAALDFGRWSRTFSPDSGAYSNRGNYWRIGADVNFLLKDPDKNLLFFGVRYGRSKFSENYQLIATDPVWGRFTSTYENADVKARWFELTGGIRVKMWKMIWMGYTARFKFALKTNDAGSMIPSDVPGYGRTDKNSTWGFNYQIFIRIPVRKAPSGPLEK